MTIHINATNIVAASTTTIIKEYGEGIVAAQHDNGKIGIFDADVEDGMLFQISNLRHAGTSGKTAIEIADEMMAA